MMKSVSFRSLLSITFCVLLLFLLPASLAFAEGNSERRTGCQCWRSMFRKA